MGYLETNMLPSELNQLLKNYIESKVGSRLEEFVIEGRMSPDAMGDMGVTGSYRKKAGDKSVFFTMTINLDSREITNLQQYA